MPKILELKVINDEFWVRISKFDVLDSDVISLWTEREVKETRLTERERCMNAIQELGRQDEVGWDHEAD